METERKGSTRVMTAIDSGVIAVKYTDQWSAFDRGSSPQLISGIGAARCACAVKSFEHLKAAGLPSHFIRQVDAKTIHVQEFSIPGHKPLSGKVHGRVLSLEWLYRLVAEGSLWGRLNQGLITRESVGFDPEIVVTRGMKLPKLFLECTTKFESTDRHLTDEEAVELAGLTDFDWSDLKELVQSVAALITKKYAAVGYNVLDGKCEIGMTEDGVPTFVDVVGTPDENRLIQAGSDNVYSKDMIRNYLDKLQWKKDLMEAKAAYPNDKSKWPPYPLLPNWLIEQVSRRYSVLAVHYANS